MVSKGKVVRCCPTVREERESKGRKGGRQQEAWLTQGFHQLHCSLPRLILKDVALQQHRPPFPPSPAAPAPGLALRWQPRPRPCTAGAGAACCVRWDDDVWGAGQRDWGLPCPHPVVPEGQGVSLLAGSRCGGWVGHSLDVPVIRC